MIPKVIHYCWISGDPFPEKIQQCYDSWKRFLPDYEIMVWDYERAHAIGSKWVDQAIKTKKYAFVADYIRFYALYNYGGIYLDSDVEVLKPFDDLLSLRYFIGKEKDSRGGIEAAIIGAEKGQPWIKYCLDYYTNRSFVDWFGDPKTIELPYIMRQRLGRKYGFVDCENKEDWIWDEGRVCLFPVDWFSPKSYLTYQIDVKPVTYCIHHFSGSWLANTAEYKRTPVQAVLSFVRRCWRWVTKRVRRMFKIAK